VAAIDRRYRAVGSLLFLGLVLAAANTRATESPSVERVSATLHDCLVALEKPSQEPLTSPCARKNVSALLGASREAILNGVGHPRWCHPVEPEVRFIPWSEPACGAAATWGYSFYRLPKGSKGGGPELVLEFGPSGAVTTAWWWGTK
jgi:hypothetical protein